MIQKIKTLKAKEKAYNGHFNIFKNLDPVFGRKTFHILKNDAK